MRKVKNKTKNMALAALHWLLYRFWLWIAGKEDISQLNGKGRRKKGYCGKAIDVKVCPEYQAYLTLAKKKQHREKKGKW